MASSVPKKVYIQIESSSEQQENVKSSRKSSRTFAVLQKTGAVDKENLVGRQPAFIAKEQLIRKTIESELSQTPETRRKIAVSNTASTSSQTSPANPKAKQVTAEDLTSEVVGEHYWEALAEKRRAALEESLTENQELYERVASLESELNQSKNMLAEAKSLVEVLTEMLEEKDAEEDVTTTTETEQKPEGNTSTDQEDA